MDRKERHTLELADGRRVRYRIDARPGESSYFVYFRGPDGRRLERSTGETSRKRALEESARIIKEEYCPQIQPLSPTWDDAIAILTRKMKAKNSRPSTINDYLLMLSNVRKAYPAAKGPAEITPSLAKNYITVRSESGLSPYTLRGTIIKLSVIWGKWFDKECEIISTNPWKGIEKPKVDEPQPRYIEPEEEKAFFDWLSKRWDGWRLPVLFFTVKGLVGRRILQLCSLPLTSLKDGRIVFPPEFNKSRKPEYARVPGAVFRELEATAGPKYVWERYPDELNAIYRSRGKRKYARCQEFRPERLKRFLQNEIIEYNTENDGKPGFVPFTAHNFRDTAMTKAWDADIDLDRAAIAYGCNRETMKKHYIRKEALAVADAVFIRVQSHANGNRHDKNGTQAEQATTSGNGQPEVNPGPKDDGQAEAGPGPDYTPRGDE